MTLIDYATPHGRAHTRAADVAFVLRAYSKTEPGLIGSIVSEQDPGRRAAIIRKKAVDWPGVDVGLGEGGTVVVRVEPEPGQTHKPAYAEVTDGPIVSICVCEGVD